MKAKPIITIAFAILSYLLRTIWFFFPSLIFLFLGLFSFCILPQGQDLVFQSRISHSFYQLIFIFIGLLFWVLSTWYTTRIIAYNQNSLYDDAPWSVTWIPRLLGYVVFMVFGAAIAKAESQHFSHWVYLGASVLIFITILIIRTYKRDYSMFFSPTANYTAIALIFIGFIALYVFWHNLNVVLFTLGIIQLSGLYWVSFRNPIGTENRTKTAGQKIKVQGWVNKRINYIFNRESKADNAEFFKLEGNLFRAFHFFAGFAVIGYIIVIVCVNLGRQIGAFAFALLAFGILLGMGNILSFLSFRNKQKINLHVIIISIVLGFGCIHDPHIVQLIQRDEDHQSYHNRDNLLEHLRAWISEPSRASLIRDTSKTFPLFFALADGGASRSGFWTSIVLSQLHDRTMIDGSNNSRFLRHLFCLTGASGGSVGNGTFLCALMAQREMPDTPSFNFCRQYLDNDFLTYPLARLLGPELLKPVFNFNWWGDRATALEKSLETPPMNASLSEQRMAELMRNDIDGFFKSEDYCPPIVCINVTRMQDSRPALISNIQVVDSIFGYRLDVFDKLHSGQGLKISNALVLGARFPYFSPAGKVGDSYFVDGGYFDNSGAGPAHEIILALEKLKNKYLSTKFKPQAEDSLLLPFFKKMRFYVIHTQNTPFSLKGFKRVHPALNDLTAPIVTLAGSYGAQTNVNNTRLENYLRELQPGENSYLPINLYTSKEDKFPMSWAISEAKLNMMINRAKEKPLIDSLVNRLNRGQMKKLLVSIRKKQ